MKLQCVIFSFICLSLFSGCNRKITSSLASVKQDSISITIHEVLKDSTVKITADTSCIDTILKVENGRVKDIKPVTRKGTRSEITTSVKDGVLHAEARCPELEIKLQNSYKEITKYQGLYRSELEKIIVPVQFVPKSIQIFAWIGVMAVLSGIAYFGIKTYIKK